MQRVDMFFKILGSSSSGNAAILRVEDVAILIDAGLSCKKIQALLKDEDISIDQLDAVFLTHEHNDHSIGLKGLSKYANLPIFANEDTVRAVQAKLSRRPNWKIFETGIPFQFKKFAVHPFSVPHDAYDPVGFYFEWGGEDLFNPRSSLAWVTDLGFAPTLVKERIRSAKILVIESNYCPQMLEQDTRRPWSLKQRIQGRHGHMSNQCTYDLLESISSLSWEKIFLMHLSKDCNNVEKVRSQFGKLPGNRSRFDTFVVDPQSSSPIRV